MASIDRCQRRHSRRHFTQAALAGAVVLTAGRVPEAVLAQEGTPVPTCPPTTPEEAEAVGRAYFDAFNAGDAEALGELLAPDYRHHGALVADQDRALHLERLRTNHDAFPDGHYEIADIFAQGDLVAIRTIFTGTLQGPYAGVEPAGQLVAVRLVHIHRIACGQIVETWNSGDALGLLRQIGALPGGEAAPRTPLDVMATPAATPAADCEPGTAEQSEAIARRWTEEALDTHNLDVLDEFVARDSSITRGSSMTRSGGMLSKQI